MRRQPETTADCDMCTGNRQLLNQLLADVAALSEKVGDSEPMRINVIDWRDGDTLVLTARRNLDDAEYHDIAERCEQYFPGRKAMLLEDGMQIGILRPQDGEPE